MLEELQTEVEYKVDRVVYKREEKLPEDQREYIRIRNYIGVAPPKSDKKTDIKVCRIRRK